jgi:hypothetical protein
VAARVRARRSHSSVLMHSVAHNFSANPLQDIAGGSVGQSHNNGCIARWQPAGVTDSEEFCAGVGWDVGPIPYRKGVGVGGLIQGSPIGHLTLGRSVKIGIGDVDGVNLLACLKILEESVHVIVYVGVGGS